MLIKYLPENMQRIKEFSYIMKTQSDEINYISAAIGKILNNSFAAYADESEVGLYRWEKIFGITGMSGKTAEERRREIICRLSDFLPYTHNALEAVILSLYKPMGVTNVRISANYDKYILSILFFLEMEPYYHEIERLLERWAPANLLTEIIIIYRRHRALKKETHKQLGVRTHRYLKKEGNVERSFT
ncbi:MAG: YmfQ family protein [Oscillospiraceae bacterium]|nr:YmfQ family protein [Oscillospiraceae bacterium]